MDIINSNTLYYFFSTIAQVLAATTALISIVLQLKVSSIRRHLIGDGQATYERARAEDVGYKLEGKYLDRLRDSIGREDLDGIEQVLKRLRDTEEKQELTKDDQPRGLQHLFQRFTKMRTQLDQVKTTILRIIRVSLITIAVTTFFLGIIDLIDSCLTYELISMGIIFFLMLWSFWETYKGVKKGIK